MSPLSRPAGDRAGLASLAILLCVCAAGVFAPVLAPFDPLAVDVTNKLAAPDAVHWLGTDYLGRDVFSRLLYGARATLLLAMAAMLATTLLGTLFGTAAAVCRGRVESLVLRLCDVVMSFPSEVLILALVGLLGPGLENVVLACMVSKWPWYARMVRTEILRSMGMNFVLQARVAGLGPFALAKRHLLPCASGGIVVLATLDTGSVVLLVSAMSFLGLGVQPPTPEWGAMLSEARNVMVLHPWQMLPPGLAILVVVAAFNFLGDALRDVLDPWHGHGVANGADSADSVNGAKSRTWMRTAERVFRGLLGKRAGPQGESDLGPVERASSGTCARTADRMVGKRLALAEDVTEQEAADEEKSDPLLRVRHLSVIHVPTGRALVNDVSFDLPKGSCLGVVGPSGSGKSLLCRALMGLVPENMRVTGSAVYFGCGGAKELVGLPEEEARALRGTGMSAVLQNAMTAFDPLRTIGDQCVETLKDRLRVDGKEAGKRLLRALLRVGLRGNVLACCPHQLSGGMLQRCMTATSLALGSSLVIADEPTTALDAERQRDVLEEFARLQRELGTTLVFVSHDLAAVRVVADTLIVMSEGRCVGAGAADELLWHPADPVTRHLVATRRALSRGLKRVRSRLDTRDRETDGRSGNVRPSIAADETALPKEKASPEESLLQGESAPSREAADRPIRSGQVYLTASSLVKTYEDRRRATLFRTPRRAVLRGVDFTLERGTVTCLLGSSGSGKSTLARLLLGLEKPDSGEICVEGRPLSLWRRERRGGPGGMAVVFQDHMTSMNPSFTVERCVAEGVLAGLGGRTRPGRDAVRDAVVEALGRVGLGSELLSRGVLSLSGGQAQRVCLARAIASRPSFVVLDEAVSSLDAAVQWETLHLLRGIRKDATWLFITHDVQAAGILADRLLVLNGGRIVDDVDLRANGDAERARPSKKLGALVSSSLSFGE